MGEVQSPAKPSDVVVHAPALPVIDARIDYAAAITELEGIQEGFHRDCVEANIEARNYESQAQLDADIAALLKGD